MNTNTQLSQYKAALAEITEKRALLEPSTYQVIVRTLLDKIRDLQTTLRSAQDVDEIRLVSVMFIDVKDSTMLARQLEERWKNVIGQAYQRLAELVEIWEGEVGQYLGDGLLCFFGARRSRGDDAVRAVSCGLAMLSRMNDYAAEVRQEYRVDFQVRAAIATGKVVVGRVGTQDRNEFLAVGQTTNLAARLQSLAEAGQLLIDTETYRRVRSHFVTTAHAPAALKGFDQPVAFYAVLERHQPTALPLIHYQIAGIDIPLVGREQELAQLRAAWDQVRQHQRFQTVTIHGEIGTGKSRLLSEIIRAIATDDHAFTLLSMSVSSEKRNLSYNLVRNLFATACNLTDDSPHELAEARITAYVQRMYNDTDVDMLAPILGYLAGYGFTDNPHVVSLRRGGPEYERIALAWLTKWFGALASTSALLITVDNLQWADALSLNLLQHLAEALAHAPVLLITTARLDFLANNLQYMHHTVQRVEMTLNALRDPDVHQLLGTILRNVSNVPPAMTTLIASRAEGNPLFIEEFLRMLFDSGIIESTAGGWKVNRFRYNTMISTLPSGLLGVLQARLDDLSPVSRAVVQAAAVVGQTFWSDAVSLVLDSDSDALLKDLVVRGIMLYRPESRFKGEAEYSFRHTLYREVSYEMVPRTTREGYHRRVANWLVSRVPDHPEYLPVVAEHYARGVQHEQALYMYVTAVDDRLERGLMDEALKLIEAGLATMPHIPREVALPMACRLWRAQGQAYNALHRYEESTTSITTALRLMDELPASELTLERTNAARILGSSYRSLGRYDQALETLQWAYMLLETIRDPQQEAAVLRAYGMLALCRGYLGESLAYFHRALIHSERIADERQIAGTLSQLSAIALDKGDLATAMGYSDRVLTINQRSSNLYFQILDLRQIAQIYRAVFAYEMAQDVLDQAARLQAATHYRDPLLDTERALCAIATGSSEDGVQRLRAAASETIQDAYERQQVQLALLQGLASTGAYQECVQHATAFVEEARLHNPILHGRGLLWLGFAQQALGDAQAVDTLKRALDLETTYAGRDIWLCHYALGLAAPTGTAASESYAVAAGIIRAIASSLHTRPELQIPLLSNSVVRTVLASGE